MGKIVAMIPARLGSQRVKAKNLRLIDGKPLISYIIEAAVRSEIFDEIYVNSEAEIFREIAELQGVKFYKRSAELASNSATNDDFALDFMEHVQCDVLIQLLATAPLLSPEEIIGFVKHMAENKYETLVSVKNEQIECVYKGEAINFNKSEQTPPSQFLTPVQVYSTGIMGWETKKFRENMRKYKCAYHGCDGKTGFYELKGNSTIDIDNEEDFRLAELVVQMRKAGKTNVPEYYKSVSGEHAETNVASILKKDGVIENDLDDANRPLVNIDELVRSMSQDSSWSKRLVNTENNSMTLICQKPGEGNRLHYHSDWNEWWYIVAGEWEWQIEGKDIRVKKGDLVFIEKGKLHKITAVGTKMAIRMAVSRDEVAHIYPDNIG